MSQTKYLKGECSHCGGRMEFPAEAIGTFADCPHCGQSTELSLALPAQPSTLPIKALVWSLIAVLILGGGLAGAMIALKRAQGMAARQKQPLPESAPPAESLSGPHAVAAQAGLNVSPIVLEKAKGSALVHAAGTVHNTTARQRFGVKIELDLFDAAGQRVGTAQDYQSVIEPSAQWRFKALVIHSKVTTAKLASIKEAQ